MRLSQRSAHITAPHDVRLTKYYYSGILSLNILPSHHAIMAQEGSTPRSTNTVEYDDITYYDDMHRFNREVHRRLADVAARQARGEPISDRPSPPPASTE